MLYNYYLRHFYPIVKQSNLIAGIRTGQIEWK